jgi:hypothetical protein
MVPELVNPPDKPHFLDVIIIINNSFLLSRQRSLPDWKILQGIDVDLLERLDPEESSHGFSFPGRGGTPICKGFAFGFSPGKKGGFLALETVTS